MTAYDADLTFDFHQPTRVLYGIGVVRDLGIELKRMGKERAVLVTDRILRTKTDLVARVEKALGARSVAIYDGVIPDTSVEAVDQGAAFASEQRADVLVSIGGGSSIDTAKGMAMVLGKGGSVRDHQGSESLGQRLIPHVAIPTTAGTGSEVSRYAVIKDAERHEKLHYADGNLMPEVAVLDPELSAGMPRALTAATGMDALTHAIEAYTALNRSPISDALALGAISLIARHLARVCEAGQDLAARGQMLIAANLAGMAFNTSGVGVVHAIAHVLGARYGVVHGVANAIALPHGIRFNGDELGFRYVDVAQAMGETAPADQAADRVAQAVERLNESIGLPRRLRDVGVPEAELEACAEQSLSDGAIVYNGKFAAQKKLLLGIYRAAY